MFALTPMVRNILLLNLLIFVLGQFLGLDLSELFGLSAFGSSNFQPYQIITHLFIHASWMHILGNMLGLIIFGPKLEMIWGPGRFLVFYFACGFGASFLHFLVNAVELQMLLKDINAYSLDPSYISFDRFVATRHLTGFLDFVNAFGDHETDPAYLAKSKEYLRAYYVQMQNSSLVGASGAIFGILLAFGMTFPRDILYILFVIPLEARFVVILYVAFELYVTLQAAPNDNVAHFAHLGGMIFAFLFARRWAS